MRSKDDEHRPRYGTGIVWAAWPGLAIHWPGTGPTGNHILYVLRLAREHYIALFRYRHHRRVCIFSLFSVSMLLLVILCISFFFPLFFSLYSRPDRVVLLVSLLLFFLNSLHRIGWVPLAGVEIPAG